MQTMFVGPKHTQSLLFVPIHGDQPLSDAQSMYQEGAQFVKQGGFQPFDRPFYFAAKRLLDLTLTLCALGLLWPLMAVMAMAIKLDSPGPIFVTQERVGVRRRRRQDKYYWEQVRFPLYKFRTTVVTAQLAPQHARVSPQTKATTRQPVKVEAKAVAVGCDSVTTVGQFLRQTSLDQLPQLWNILRGDLTLVGPRPALPAELKNYTPCQLRRFETIPGMTGLWQLQDYRTEKCTYPSKVARARQKALNFDKMVQLDIEYIEKQSLGLDLRILGNTFLTVLRSHTKRT